MKKDKNIKVAGNLALEEFEINNDNLAKVKVRSQSGEDITKNCTVSMEFNKNALIGFATELLRLANNFEVSRHSHIEPITENIIQEMGIILTPDSSELVVMCSDLGNFNSYRK